VTSQLQPSFDNTLRSELVINSDGAADIVLVCEHASNYIPDEFSDLGLDKKTLNSHIAWDPGALSVAKGLSRHFDAPLVTPAVSRLVYDCNRHADVESAIPETSENDTIPGNRGLTGEERKAREQEFYIPFRNALTSVIKRTVETKSRAVVVTIHSFSPVYKGEARDFDLGILHDSDARLADRLLQCIDDDGTCSARRNQPYGPEDDVTFTLAEHAVPDGLLNVMIEIRNDLIVDEKAIQTMVDHLSGYLESALKEFENEC